MTNPTNEVLKKAELAFKEGMKMKSLVATPQVTVAVEHSDTTNGERRFVTPSSSEADLKFVVLSKHNEAEKQCRSNEMVDGTIMEFRL
jgi:hypothetical protein